MSATAKLYELADLRQIIDQALVETEGELTPEIAAALDAWETDFPNKVESVALYICDLEADAVKIKAEEEKLAARRSALLNRAKDLTNYLQVNLERTGTKKVEGVLKTVSLQNNPPSVKEVVPTNREEFRHMYYDDMAEYVRYTPEDFSWNRDAIKAAAKAGTLPEDISRRVAVVQTKGLRIR